MLSYLTEQEKAFVLGMAWGLTPSRAAIKASPDLDDPAEAVRELLERQPVRRAIRALCDSRRDLRMSQVLEDGRLRPESDIPAEIRPHIKVTLTKRGKVNRVEFTDPTHIACLRRLIPYAPVGA